MQRSWYCSQANVSRAERVKESCCLDVIIRRRWLYYHSNELSQQSSRHIQYGISYTNILRDVYNLDYNCVSNPFKEWSNRDAKDVLDALAGLLTIIVGVFLLHAFRDVKFSILDLPSLSKFVKSSSRPRTDGAEQVLMQNIVEGDSNEDSEVEVKVIGSSVGNHSLES